MFALIRAQKSFSDAEGEIMVRSFRDQTAIGLFDLSHFVESVFFFRQLTYMFYQINQFSFVVKQKIARELNQSAFFQFDLPAIFFAVDLVSRALTLGLGS